MIYINPFGCLPEPVVVNEYGFRGIDSARLGIDFWAPKRFTNTNSGIQYEYVGATMQHIEIRIIRKNKMVFFRKVRLLSYYACE
jgi:hypothetical protein